VQPWLSRRALGTSAVLAGTFWQQDFFLTFDRKRLDISAHALFAHTTEKALAVSSFVETYLRKASCRITGSVTPLRKRETSVMGCQIWMEK
jgi:hypothetical protein